MKKKFIDILKHPMFNLVTFSMILLVLFLLLAGFTNFNFKVGNVTIIAGKRDNTNIIKAVTEAVMIQMSMGMRLTEQVAYMNDKVDLMITEILHHHIQLLKEHGIKDNYFSHPQYRAYKNLVENALDKMEENSINRFTYMATHFSENNMKEFKEYAKNTATEYINSVGGIIQDGWVDIIVTKEENFEWTRQLVPRIVELIIDIYDTAFEIQIKYQKRIVELENSYKSY